MADPDFDELSKAVAELRELMRKHRTHNLSSFGHTRLLRLWMKHGDALLDRIAELEGALRGLEDAAGGVYVRATTAHQEARAQRLDGALDRARAVLEKGKL